MKAKPARPWGIRIVGTGFEKAGQLLAHPSNWRTHGPAQESQLTSLLHDVGFVAPIIVNVRSDPAWGRDQGVQTMVDGHLRVKAAMARGEDVEVPVVYVDLLPREERRVLLQLDPIGEMAGRDKDVLAGLSEEVVVEWTEADIDLDAILRRDRKRTKGLAHDVRACKCCEKGCVPGCGCYRDPEAAKEES